MPEAMRTNKKTGSLKPIPGRCGAKLKRSDPPKYCKKYPMKGRKRCERCGGKSPRGPACASFKGKGYSAYMPSRLREKFEALILSTDYLDQREEIAVVAAMIKEEFEGWKEGAARKWQELIRLQAKIRDAKGGNDPVALGDALNEFLALDLSQVEAEKVKDRLERQLDLHRRLVESERKRMIEDEQMIQLEKVLAMLDSIAQAVKEHVTDENALRAIGGSLSHWQGGRSVFSVN